MSAGSKGVSEALQSTIEVGCLMELRLIDRIKQKNTLRLALLPLCEYLNLIVRQRQPLTGTRELVQSEKEREPTLLPARGLVPHFVRLPAPSLTQNYDQRKLEKFSPSQRAEFSEKSAAVRIAFQGSSLPEFVIVQHFEAST